MNNWIGEIGQKLKLNLELIETIKSFDLFQNPNYKLTFKDSNEDIIIVKGNSKSIDKILESKDKNFIIEGIIKNHIEWGDNRETYFEKIKVFSI